MAATEHRTVWFEDPDIEAARMPAPRFRSILLARRVQRDRALTWARTSGATRLADATVRRPIAARERFLQPTLQLVPAKAEPAPAGSTVEVKELNAAHPQP